ncbi:MAG: peroxidase family protein, partial [Pseudomonadota bacterium]
MTNSWQVSNSCDAHRGTAEQAGARKGKNAQAKATQQKGRFKGLVAKSHGKSAGHAAHGAQGKSGHAGKAGHQAHKPGHIVHTKGGGYIHYGGNVAANTHKGDGPWWAKQPAKPGGHGPNPGGGHGPNPGSGHGPNPGGGHGPNPGGGHGPNPGGGHGPNPGGGHGPNPGDGHGPNPGGGNGPNPGGGHGPNPGDGPGKPDKVPGPKKQNKADQHIPRLADPAYGDGKSTMGGEDRPNPRAISNAVAAQNGQQTQAAKGVSSMVWNWGQFIDHDVVLTKEGEEKADIIAPKGDKSFDPFG